MYVIEKWNGQYDQDYQVEIVAGFLTLKEASVWCHVQRPTKIRYGKEEVIPIKQAFEIYHIEGESVTVIPYPWKDASNEES